MNEHTSGPWKVVTGAVFTEGGVPIAMMDRETGNGTLPVERDHNAYLIAAAPDLLEAAKGALNHLETYDLGDDGRVVDASHMAIANLRDALKKAEGGTI